MVSYAEDTFVNARKQKIFTVSYIPNDAPLGVFFFCHGLGEYIGRYKEGANALNAASRKRFKIQNPPQASPRSRLRLA